MKQKMKEKYLKDVEWLKKNIPSERVYDFCNQLIETVNYQMNAKSVDLKNPHIAYEHFLNMKHIKENMKHLNYHRDNHLDMSINLKLHD